MNTHTNRCLIACTLSLLAAAGTLAAAETRLAPFAQPPVIDGKLTPGEWDRAVNFGPLCGPFDGGASPRNATARFGWTPERLYLLVESEVWPGFVPGKEQARDSIEVVLNNPGIECWLDPNRANRDAGAGDRRYYQAIIDATGGILDAVVDERHVPSDAWNGAWQTATAVDEKSGLMVIEASIPWTDLGVTAPLEGRILGVALGYNFIHPFAQLQWAPLRSSAYHGYMAPDSYPVVRLDSTAPCVQVERFEPTDGDAGVAAELRIANPGPARSVKIALTATPAKAESTVAPVAREQTLDLPADGQGTLRLEVPADLKADALFESRLSVTSADGKIVYFDAARPVRRTPPAPAQKWTLPPPAPKADDPAMAAKAVRYILNFHAPDKWEWFPADAELNKAVRAALTPEQAQRAIVQRGDTARLRRVLAKAEAGEPVTIGMIGGSITQGNDLNPANLPYAALLANWWKLRFPKSALTLANAARGGTGSDYAAHRAERDLFPYKPDLVIVEFCVNDADTRERGESYEGLMRQILRQPQAPAVIAFTVYGNMDALKHGDHEWHGKVIAHYDLPHVSARRAVAPEMVAGTLPLKDHLADAIHPNAAGHRLLAASLASFLEQELALPGKPAAATADAAALPAPVLSDRFERGRIIPANELTPVAVKGFARYLGKWYGGFVGDEIAFEIEGAGSIAIGVNFSGTPYMKAGEVRVDDRDPVLIDPYKDWAFTIVCYTEVARDLPPGKHTVRVRTVPSPNNKWKTPVDYYHGFYLTEFQLAGPLPKMEE